MGQVKNSIERVFDLFFFVDFYLFLGICGCTQLDSSCLFKRDSDGGVCR